MKKILILIVVVIILAIGYWLMTKKDRSTTLDTTMIDYCGELKETIFTSIEKYETGRGGSMGYYAINFWEDYFTWSHSDFSESGSYTCNNNSIKVTLAERPSINIQYDPVTKTFTWDGIIYKLTGPIPTR